MHSLAGRGFVAIWNGIPAVGRQDFVDWHREEHMPERLAIPGFLGGTRWRADEAPLEFFTLYTLAEPEVSRSAAYLARLNDPSPWTQRVMRQFQNNRRCVGFFGPSAGEAPGERVLVGCLVAEAEEDWAAVAAGIAALPGVAGCHLGLADQAISALPTAERQGRDVGEPQGVVLVVLARDVDVIAVREAVRALLPVGTELAGFTEELALP
ncbi:hypothetical protein [Devosia sp. 1566]|uniref:hypothetical protein n=1 Tax=Devosia sp. 1566 TaxID=2499144 RepID=UPI000FDAEB43|nr:hypothetical protein [Devosia sp. 1566]